MQNKDHHWLANLIRADKAGTGTGLLLNADQVWKSKRGEETSRAIFRLHSNRFQKEFVTLWELFDEHDNFDRCISELAALAKDVRKERPFASIVTCTPTARYITDHLHSKIEGDQEKVDLQFLWHHPFFTLDGKPLSEFDNEGVLIVTDVVATGTLVAQMAETVERLGGNPVAVLAVLIVDEHLASELRVPYRSTKESAKQTETSEQIEYLRLFRLTDYSIESIQPESNAFDTDKILSIDSRTVLPKDPDPAPLFDFKPKFDEFTMLEQFDRANALQFGFFAADDSKFTIAVNFDRILHLRNGFKSGPPMSTLPDSLWLETWNAISNCFQLSPPSAPPTLVTTFDAEDLRFKDFVEQRLRQEGVGFEKAYISKHDAHEWASGYFILPQHAQKLKERRVVLMLASVHSAEKLRNLASLLASYSVASIDVICLLNRMGNATRNFMLRIENLLRGLGSQPGKVTGFRFTYLYSLIDIDSDDIENAQVMVDSLLSGYKKATRVSNFRRLAEQDRSYFRFRTTTSREFQTYTSPDLQTPFSIPSPTDVVVKTQAAEAAVLVSYLIQTRDFTPLIAEIRQIATMRLPSLLPKRSLFHTYAVLLCYLGYLRVGNTLQELREALREAIGALRRRRLNPESKEEADAAEMLTTRETDLLFGLALFSYLTPDGEVERLVDEALFCGRTATHWLTEPRNLLLHFGEERISYVVSLALHLSNPRFRAQDSAASLKKRLVAKIIDLLKNFQNTLTDEKLKDIPRGKELRSRTINNLNFLLKEMEGQRQIPKHEIVGNLLRDLVDTKIDHSPMVTGLKNVPTKIADFLYVVQPDRAITGNMISFADHELQENLSAALEDAVYSTGILEDIVASIRRLFMFTPCDWSKAQYFASERGDLGLAQTLWLLGDLLQGMRMDKQVSWTQHDKVLKYTNEIFERVWDPESYLRSLLESYVCPLRATLVGTMEAAEKVLQEQFGEVWGPQISVQRDILKKEGEVYVLFWEPGLFRVLENLFTNARHSLIEASGKHSYADDVALSFEPTGANKPEGSEAPKDLWRIQVDSFGKEFDKLPLSCTLANQQEEVIEMGGGLSLDGINQGERKGARATLAVYMRKPVERQHGGEDESAKTQRAGMGR